MTNDYKNRVNLSAEADALDKLQGENAILTNKQNATNAFLQGVMGNIASNRGYAVEKDKLAIASMDAKRGTSYRSAKELLKNPNISKEMKAFYQSVVDAEELPTKAKGGYIKSKRKVGYC